MLSELRPCPFCGGEASKVKGVGFKVHGVVCTKCPCEFVWFGSEQEAVTAWNQRADRTCTIDRDYCCSECESDMAGVLAYDSPFQRFPNYCPNCGAKVV